MQNRALIPKRKKHDSNSKSRLSLIVRVNVVLNRTVGRLSVKPRCYWLWRLVINKKKVASLWTKLHTIINILSIRMLHRRNVTLRLLLLLFTIFSGGTGRSGIFWILIFMIPVVFYLNDSWFSSRFMIHEDFWSPIHLMMFYWLPKVR